MEQTSSSVLSIPANVSFADALANGLLTKFGDQPENLARLTLLLPTRRACRTIRDAFLRLSNGKPMLLPRMHPLGDMDEDELSLNAWQLGDQNHHIPPAISPLRRQFLLTRTIMASQGDRITPDQAAHLATELANLLDQVHTESLSFEQLAELVPADYAEHWNVTLNFLQLLTQVWPAILAEEGCIDPADRRNRLLDRQREIWEHNPPRTPIIAAGSTASIPAVARLLACIAQLEQGMVVLPGLDQDMDRTDWQNLEPTHPQYGLSQLLGRLNLAPKDVGTWDYNNLTGCHPTRTQLLSQAMLPARSTDKWRRMAPPHANVLDGVERIDCPTSHEEAGAIALMLRRELEYPGHTAALVTPDRNLARRVASELRRWNIEIDDSAGQPLQHAAPGAFLRLLAQCGAENFAPIAFLSLIKHPLCSLGMAPGIFRRIVRQLELMILRGPRPAAGLDGIRAAVKRRENEWRRETGRLTTAKKKRLEEINDLLDQLDDACAPFVKVMARKSPDFLKLISAHVKCAETLATTHEVKGVDRLWAGEAGQCAADFISEVLDAAKGFGGVAPSTYPAFFDTLISAKAVRPRFGAHPRLSILGLFEARLQQRDLIVLAGLNEGTWPPDAGASPWMSRPMMRDFGLPVPEAVIGQTAHDFAQNFCAPRVIITRSERVDGTPTVRSRWLRRLENRLNGSPALAQFSGRGNWQKWQQALDRVNRIQAVSPPAPRPPLSARPRHLYVTAVERWMRDPYALYAKEILKLRALDPIDADPGAADYGNIIHDALDRFMNEFPRDLPENADLELRRIGRETFGNELENPGVWAFWWPRFERICDWFIKQERERRPLIQKTYSEIKGSLTFSAPNGPFTVSAKADRIDLYKDGTIAIIDYKTGAPPTPKEVNAGFAPQLPLEAAIAQDGGFEEFGERCVAHLEFWRLKGSNPAGERKPASPEPNEIAKEALEGLQGLVSAFDRQETPYAARPNPSVAKDYCEYQHLARIKEWSTAAQEEE